MLFLKEEIPWLDYKEYDEENDKYYFRKDIPDDIRQKYYEHIEMLKREGMPYGEIIE